MKIKNPCKKCIVVSMCKKDRAKCDLLEGYLLFLRSIGMSLVVLLIVSMLLVIVTQKIIFVVCTLCAFGCIVILSYVHDLNKL
jgi:hypothetical protein